MKALYLRIYLTVVAVLLAFALVAGWVAQRHVDDEREHTRNVWSERAAGWAMLLQNSLPEPSAPLPEQQRALNEWSDRLRLPMALDDANGLRIATSPKMEMILRDTDRSTVRVMRVPLSDGRVLWTARPTLRTPSSRSPMMAMPPTLPNMPNSSFGMPPFLGGGALIVALLAIFTAVALGAWPVVRRLTRRLEALQRSVRRFGSGDLSHRVQIDGQDEVAAVAQSFNDAAQRIEQLIRANRSLLANASHELRSPLARLKMALALLDDASPERRAALRDEIEHDIRELDELVEEVLLSSRLDAQADMSIEACDLIGLAAEEAAWVGATLELSPATQAQGTLKVQGNERLLRRALRNLLENARRYGVPPGATAEQAITLELERSPTHATLRVCDRGPGVPSAQRERIFEPFYRLSGHTEKAGGVGLGLSLVKQIAQRHGGTVFCTDRPAGGCCFVLSLPLDGPPAVQRSAVATAELSA